MDERSIAIVGPGTVGTAVGVAASRAGWQVVVVSGRDEGRTAEAAKRIGHDVRACSPAEAAGAADVVLLTVSDDAIEPVCRELAGSFRPGAVVAHCSGALDSSVLAAGRKHRRCRVASMHPLQTFPSVDAAVDKLAGTYFFCEGDAEALTVVEQLIADLGGHAVRLSGGAKAKALYHAAAVMACNYLPITVEPHIGSADDELAARKMKVVLPQMRQAVEAVAADPDLCRAGLFDDVFSDEQFGAMKVIQCFQCGFELMGEAGIDRKVAIEALLPLVRATLDNIAAVGPAAALTGPIARGDVETIKRHLRVLRGHRHESLYRANGQCTVLLAQRKGRLPAATARELSELFAERLTGLLGKGLRSSGWLRRLLTARRWRKPSSAK